MPLDRYALNRWPTQVVTTDVNHDGIQDLLASGSASGTSMFGGSGVGGLEVLLGNGDGTFGQPSYFGGVEASGLAVADFNGDGNLDVALATGATISLYMGDGHGSFAARYTVPVCGTGRYHPITTGDFNGDLACGDNRACGVWICNRCPGHGHQRRWGAGCGGGDEREPVLHRRLPQQLTDLIVCHESAWR